MTPIDLNADIGEGFVDMPLLEAITSANVACGFHAGGEQVARPLCAAAAERGIAIGAHISYRDRPGFGREELGTPAAVVAEEAREQIALLQEWSGGRVTYVKPHGALYHRMRRDDDVAAAIAAAGLLVLGLDVSEGFADRGYRGDGLIPRGEPGALLNPDEAVAQAVRLARAGTFRSICLHGDSPGAVALAVRLRDALAAAGFELAPFA
ncbi:MAG TPA: LamB/YcsF family protein [Gaiellaceae bacterium]|nr:LamB/YcsF family protein [Gaiellaceae bacterium]